MSKECPGLCVMLSAWGVLQRGATEAVQGETVSAIVSTTQLRCALYTLK